MTAVARASSTPVLYINGLLLSGAGVLPSTLNDTLSVRNSKKKKKWIIERRHYDLRMGMHWVSWLPLKGTRRMTCVKWFGEISGGTDVAPLGIIMSHSVP